MNIPFNKPHLTGNEAHYMYQAVYGGKLSGNGQFKNKCQQCVKDSLGFIKCQMNKSWKIFVILLCNTLFFSVVAWLLPSCFETNDDLLMCVIANGMYSGAPDCHLVFINAIFGCLLKLLYTTFGGIEWYAVLFSVFQILSITQIVHILSNLNISRSIKCSVIVFVYALWVYIIAAFQFTTTAGLLAVAGFLSMLVSTKKGILVGSIGIILAALIRYHVAALTCLLFFPFFMNKYRLEIKKYIPLVLILFVVFSNEKLNTLFYKEQKWQEFIEFNHKRSGVEDNPNAFNKNVIDHLPHGVSKRDFILVSAGVSDPQIMNLDVMRDINSHITSVTLKQKIYNILKIRKYILPFLLLFALCIAVFYSDTNKKTQWFYLAYLVYLGLLMCYISLSGYLKLRVFVCMLMPSSVLVFWALSEYKIQVNKITASLIFFGLTIYSGYLSYQEHVSVKENRLNYTNYQKPLLAKVDEHTYVTCIGDDVDFESINPFHVQDLHFKRYVIGWFAKIPFNKPIATSHLDLTNDNIVILTTDSSNNVLKMIQESILEHYQTTTHCVVLDQNDKYALVKLIKERETIMSYQ